MRGLSLLLLLAAAVPNLSDCGMLDSSEASVLYDLCIKEGKSRETCSCIHEHLAKTLSNREQEVLIAMTVHRHEMKTVGGMLEQLPGIVDISFEELLEILPNITQQMQESIMSCG